MEDGRGGLNLKKCSTLHLGQFVGSQEKKLNNILPRPCLGNGAGCLGFLSAGDSSGAILLLRLQDVIRQAKAESFSSFLAREKSRRRKILDEALEELQLR